MIHKAKEVKYEIDETSQAYREGYLACLAGEPTTTCPYLSEHGLNGERYVWMYAWFDCKLKQWKNIKENLPIKDVQPLKKNDNDMKIYNLGR